MKGRIKQINGNKVIVELGNGSSVEVVKGIRLKKELILNKEYLLETNEKNGIIYLNDVKEYETENKFLEEIKNMSNPYDIKQLIILAQSCQHDAVKIVSSGIDLKDYGSVEELGAEIIKLRDFLVEDLFNKYIRKNGK